MVMEGDGRLVCVEILIVFVVDALVGVEIVGVEVSVDVDAVV